MNKKRKEKKIAQIFFIGFFILLFGILFNLSLNNTNVVYSETDLEKLEDELLESLKNDIDDRDLDIDLIEDPNEIRVNTVDDDSSVDVVELPPSSENQNGANSNGANSNNQLIYKPLEEIPGVDYSSTGDGNPGGYLQSIIKVIIGITTALAVITIVIAGVEHIIGAGKESTLTAAKEKVWGALLGLILALASFVILKTINPNLLNLELNTEVSSITSNQLTPTTPTTPTTNNFNVLNHVEAAKRFENNGIKVTSTSGVTGVKAICSTGDGCTSLNKIRESTVNEIINLKKNCSCEIKVIGGTEPGHASGKYSHGNGYKIDVVLNGDLNNYITNTKNFTRVGIRSGLHGGKIYKDAKGNEYVMESSHWDITIY